MRKLLAVFILLSVATAGRVGLVVQFSDNETLTECVNIPVDNSVQPGCSVNPLTWCNENTGSSTAEKVLRSSGLKVVMADEYIAFPGCSFGRLLCRIEGVGCDASGSSCVGCGSNYWGFFYMKNGGWRYSECGVSGFNVKEGDVLGFRWGYMDLPAVYSFNEICASASQVGGVQPLRKLSIETGGNCTGQPVVVKVKEEGDWVIWEPTNFIFPSKVGLNITLESGVGVNVLLHRNYFGEDAGFEKTAFIFTDKDGMASFTPQKPGSYKLIFEKEGFIGEEREIEVGECEREATVSIRAVEETKLEEQPPTRVIIAAPKTALLNSTVVVRMLSEGGEPVVYEKLIVKFSGGEKQLITNESGEATFTPEEEGVYSYYSPAHLLGSYEVTNVIKETPIVLAPPDTHGNVEGTPSVGMATASPSPLLLAGGVIVILALLYLIKEVRK